MEALPLAAILEVDRAAFGLLLAIVVDLMVRFVAFGHLESIAIDSAVFAAMYSAIEAARHGAGDSVWMTRSLIGGVLVLVLVVIHFVLRGRLESQINEYMVELHAAAQEPDEKTALLRAQRLANHSVLVTFVPLNTSPQKIRGGKKERIREVVQYIRAVAPSVAVSVDEEKFTLSQWERWLGAAAFLTCGIMAVITPFLNVK